MATLSFLLGSDAASARMTERKPLFVAHMETARGFVELDAESVDHAHTLCAEWCRHGRAISAAARRVASDGTLSRVIGRIHSDVDHLAESA